MAMGFSVKTTLPALMAVAAEWAVNSIVPSFGILS